MGLPQFMKSTDVESPKNGQLYPNQMESPQLRWAFIRKVYAILCSQLILTTIVAGIVLSVKEIRTFFHTSNGAYTLIFLVVLSIAIYIALWWLHKKHPWNNVLLFVYTICMALMVGAVAATKSPEGIFLAVILTLTITVGLILYTFWAVKRGVDFAFLGPFLFAASLMLFVLGLMMLFTPLKHVKMFYIIFAALGGILACAYIVYDTDNIIMRLSYDEYIIGAIELYIDIINLFLSILRIIG